MFDDLLVDAPTTLLTAHVIAGGSPITPQGGFDIAIATIDPSGTAAPTVPASGTAYTWSGVTPTDTLEATITLARPTPTSPGPVALLLTDAGNLNLAQLFYDPVDQTTELTVTRAGVTLFDTIVPTPHADGTTWTLTLRVTPNHVAAYDSGVAIADTPLPGTLPGLQPVYSLNSATPASETVQLRSISARG